MLATSVCVAGKGAQVCAYDYPCCYQWQAAIHSGWNERFSSVTKQFLCFHGAMILSKSWCYDSVKIPEKIEGGEKKINVPPITSSSLSLAGRCHAHAHANTCMHGQCKTQKQRNKLALWLQYVYSIFFLSDGDGRLLALCWIFWGNSRKVLEKVTILRG